MTPDRPAYAHLTRSDEAIDVAAYGSASPTVAHPAFRQTPAGAPTVPDLVKPGDVVRLDGGERRFIVVRLKGPFWVGTLVWCAPHGAVPADLTCFGFWMVPEDDFLADQKARRLFASRGVNGIVAVGRRILDVFRDGRTEVTVVGHRKRAARIAHRIPVQLDIFWRE